ncbi:MAG: UDP-N-acetylmuramoyl-tripeptide--D-alanyl-D-alanine ligase, partial [Gammaproteobacteria bacterium]
GELAAEAVAAFAGPGGAFATLDELLVALRAELCGPLHILVKGSRSMRMERVVTALRVAAGDGGVY